MSLIFKTSCVSRFKNRGFNINSKSAFCSRVLPNKDYFSSNNNNEEANDIFGIETDDGAICFTEDKPVRNEKFKHLFERRKKNKDILRSTHFGKLRLDSENSEYSNHLNATSDLIPKTTSQAFFDKTTKSRFKNEITYLSNLNLTKRELSEDLSFKQMLAKNDNDTSIALKASPIHENYVDQCYEVRENAGFSSGTSIPDTVPTNSVQPRSEESSNQLKIGNKITETLLEETKMSSFVDEQYFGEFVETRDIRGNSELEQSIEKKNFNRDNSLSEIDKQYFGDDFISEKPFEHENIVKNSGKTSTTGFDNAESRLSRSINYPQNTNDIGLMTPDETSLINETESLDFLDEIKADESETENAKDIESSKAYDYVVQMKKATFIKDAVKSSGQLTNLTGEKLDSKGFRILENQVPDLSRLTRDELLEFLRHRVIFANDDVLVLDKPYNLVMHEAKTNKEPSLSAVLDDLAAILDPRKQNPKLYTVHRLDKETTGCLILARSEMSAQYLKSLFVQRKILKTYWVVTTYVPDPMEGIIDIPIAEGSIGDKARMVLHPKLPKDLKYRSHAKRGNQAITNYKVLATSGNAALIEAKPETGLKHQIRVHFGFGLGCPILGDHKYSHLDKMAPQRLPSDMLQKLHVRQSKVRYIPMHIHARSIVIPQSLNGRNLFANAAVPDHMRKNLQRLKFRRNEIRPNT